ncbi:MAG: VOC family protein [Planctomycetota bacterium]|nr:MAG: VOC family protein [Planctomycetota bacterium]
MQHAISTFLWFESKADEAAKLYCSIFPNSRITQTSPMSTSFELDGQRFTAFNGGPHYKLTPAVSVFIPCDSQAEVDALWNRFLAEGGTESKCGWLVDRFGLSWQIIPKRLLELMGDRDPARAQRVVQAMLAMQKIDVAALERAHRG